MLLTIQQSYELLAKHGCYVREACDRCGQVLGHMRYTRKGDDGVWCSRECRDGKEAHAPRTCKHCRARLLEGKRRGAIYCDDSCKEAAHRSKAAVQTSRARKLSVTKTSIYAAFPPKKEPVGISGHPGAFGSPREEMVQQRARP
jgi:hypothetical protein